MNIPQSAYENLMVLINLNKSKDISKDQLIDMINLIEKDINPQIIQQKHQNKKVDILKTNLETYIFNSRDVLNKEKIERYSRQMILSDISYQGQLRIQKSKILIIGAGGLGSPAALYLAGMGVGKLGIIDGDCVELSNLHRQIIHTSSRVGVNKARSAQIQISNFNPLTEVQVYETFLTQTNANSIFKDYDIILDASDNAKTRQSYSARYLVNDAAITNKKYLVSGAAVGWSGQITVLGYQGGPCYRCLNPICPKSIQNCAIAGVVGMMPGIIGQLQALEALKIILDMEDVLVSKMLLFDGKQANFRKIQLRKRQMQSFFKFAIIYSNCVVCGDNPQLTDVEKYDYDNFTIGSTCAVEIYPSLDSKNNITWEDFLKITQDKIYIDVRPSNQYNIINLQNFQNIPIDDLINMNEVFLLFKGKNQIRFYRKKWQSIEIQYILCAGEVMILEKQFSFCFKIIFKVFQVYVDVFNIIGGITEYSQKFDENIPLI